MTTCLQEKLLLFYRRRKKKLERDLKQRLPHIYADNWGVCDCCRLISISRHLQAMISALLQEGQSGRKKAPMPAKVFLAKAAKDWRTIVSVLLIVFLLRVILGGS